MSRDDILLEAEMTMEKSVDYMVHEFAAVRTGKASPGLVENVDVHAYGSTMKLKQLALITTPEARCRTPAGSRIPASPRIPASSRTRVCGRARAWGSVRPR